MMRRGVLKSKQTSRIEQVLRGLAVAGAAGILLLAIEASGQPGWAAGARYLFVGGLAALTGLGIGVVVGLVFGLPESSPVMPGVVPDSQNGGAPAAGPTAPSTDWYRDSSALERIATWLTGAIIALSLANFDAWTERFDHAAVAVGAMMGGHTIADREAASRNAAALRDEIGHLAQTGGETPDAFRDRSSKASAALKTVERQLVQSQGEDAVTGGLLLGAYALIGFISAYLWTRRYLPMELANGRLEMRDVGRMDKSRDAAALSAAQANGLNQSNSAAADPAAAAEAVTSAAKGSPLSLAADVKEADPDAVKPGSVIDDPWKGQFNGTATSARAEVTANVREAAGRPGVYLVVLTIRGRTPGQRRELVGSAARLYLHPTFPQPIIRAIPFDGAGIAEVTLSAYGAFTVGIQLIPSDERLELDLAGLSDAPVAFRLN